MKAQDLRVGNWVYSCQGGIETKIGLICEGQVMIEQPIPLTEEWLLKMGYKWKDNYKCYVKTYGNNEESIIDTKFVVMDMDYTPIIKHVHQLQNLYHALTGEELTIK